MRSRFWAAVSDQGSYRKKNQDALLIHEIHAAQGHVLVACVCDGVGSYEYSERASIIVIQGIDIWTENLKEGKLDHMDAQELAEDLLLTVSELSEIIYEKQFEDSMNLGCTMSLLLMIEDTYYIFHVGDSRIYAGKDQLYQITEDDVEISKEDGRKRLCNCMGIHSEIYIHRYGNKVTRDMVWILGSDGLFNRQSVEEYLDVIQRADSDSEMRKICEDMIAHVRSKGERDNISCILIGPERLKTE